MSIVFRYEARGSSGRLERGRLVASNQQDALNRLYRRNLTPFALKQEGGARDAPRLPVTAARDLCRALAQLLRSGLSFAQALRFASEELAPAAASAASRMREAAEEGEPASQALEAYSGAEARLLQGVVLAGETSGRLADALDVAATSFARSADLRARVGTALVYPSFVIAATLATLACFLLLVVPTLAQAFSGAEDKLPDETRSLLALSAWLQANGWLLLAGAGALAILISASVETRRALSAILDQVLVSKLALGVTERLEFSAFASLAALSIEAGVPSAAAFDAAAAGVRNRIMRERLNRTIGAIRSGERPSIALERFAQPPKSLLRLMHVGEETGRLAEALKNAGALLSSEAEQRLARLGAIAGPLVTLGLGALVASIVMSLFLGLLALSDLATA
ncbi:MAG: type II secretion system F family protein [Pseudomonadota bacterium]